MTGESIGSRRDSRAELESRGLCGGWRFTVGWNGTREGSVQMDGGSIGWKIEGEH